MSAAAERVRSDVLIAEARARFTESRLGKSWARETDKDLVVIRNLADALEAATGGQHIDAKHWAEVTRLRTRVDEEARRNDALAHTLAQAVIRADEASAEVERLRRLHEEAMTNNVILRGQIAEGES